MNPRKRIFLIAVLGLFVVQGLVSRAMFPTWVERYSAGNIGIAAGLTPDQLLASMSGLRELVAGVLWVRSDEFFHTGQFDAILPVIRLVTWLNPRQLEVYSTGAWHIAYNFTDEQSRSDRRYIPLALRLLEEGVQANPNTYTLYHDSGWMYFHKIDDDHHKAVHWFQQSVQKPDILPALRSVLATAYQRNGQLDEALDLYWFIYQDYARKFVEDGDNQDRQMRDAQEKNLDNLIVRMASRGVFGRRDGVYDQYPYDTHDPVDLRFTTRIQVLDPKVIRVDGTWGIPTTGARVRMVVRDSQYNLVWEAAPELDFEHDRNQTYMLDSLYTQDGRFDRRIDMSRNPTMYPFRSETYYVEFYFNPRSAPPHIQDKTGWDGEGMTDQRFLNTEERPGTRILFARFELTRDQLLKRGDYADGYIFRSPGYEDVATREDGDIIIRRSLRGQ